MKITNIKELKKFSDEHEEITTIEIEPECLEQIERDRALSFRSDYFTEDTRILDCLLERFDAEGTSVVCQGKKIWPKGEWRAEL